MFIQRRVITFISLVLVVTNILLVFFVLKQNFSINQLSLFQSLKSSSPQDTLNPLPDEYLLADIESQTPQAIFHKKVTSPSQNKEKARIYLVNSATQLPELLTTTLDKKDSHAVKNVVVLATDTSDLSNSYINTSDLPWKTSHGFLYPITINNTEPLPVAMQKAMFQENKQVAGIASIIKESFPKARILPIVQKIRTPEVASIELADSLTGYLSSDDTVVIFLVEWAHDLYPAIVSFQDITAMEVLSSRDLEGVERLNTHSDAPLKTALRMADNWGYSSFKVTDNVSLSAVENNQLSRNDSSLHGYFVMTDKQENATISKATALVLGDVMLDRFMRQTINRNGFNYLLDKQMNRFLRGTDITMVNFESAMTDFRHYRARNNMMTFTSDPATAPHLAGYGINMASLSNNHSLNFGPEGFAQTKDYLGEAGIETFGTPFNRAIGGEIYTIKTIRGMKIAFIGYHELYEYDLNPILEKISELRNSVDFITIVSHWGAEYGTLIPRYQQKSARKLIDAGADLIIGHHPHVVQPMEIYKNKMIFYSLGNFLFDQRGREKVRVRLAVGITYECTKTGNAEGNAEDRCSDTRIVSRLYPLYANRKYQVSLMSEAKKKGFFQWFWESSKI